ncbi:MAG: division/cell wall cluster transcriptional repressor MraZ [Phycisphaerae bacterium]
MVITDRYDHVIDDKNRLAIPSQVRNRMDPQADGEAFYLVPENRYLVLIPEKLFEKLASQATAGLAMTDEEAEVRRMVFATASRLEPDKSGRVIIPDRFMLNAKDRDPFTEAVLDREVTLVGVGDRMELWNRADLAAHMRELRASRARLQPAKKAMFTAPAAPSVPGPGGMGPNSGNAG